MLHDSHRILLWVCAGERKGLRLSGEAVLYTYGPDADALLEAVRSRLGDFPMRPGALH